MAERFYPELSEAALKEAENFIESFRNKIKVILEEVLKEAYCDYLPWIESDSWTNVRSQIEQAIVKNYPKEYSSHGYYRELRDRILIC